MATVALHIIAKDDTKDVARIVQELRPYVDAIDVAWDTECAVDKVNNYYYEWSEEEKKRGFPNFDDKRNFLVSKCTCDYYLRIDTDDFIEEPEKIKELANKMEATGVSLLSCWYDYGRDSGGNCHSGQFRETFIKNDGNYKWNKNIHENIIPIDGDQPEVAIEQDFKIIHLADYEHFKKSQERNIKFLLEEYERDKDKTDSRTLAYLGRTLYPMGYLNDAKFFLQKHIETSGWDEDRCMSWVMLSDIYNDQGEWEDAVQCCQKALGERPDFPEPYFKLHELYMLKKKWGMAIHWGKIALQLQKPHSFTAYDPASYTWRPAWTMAHCYMMIDEPETAYKFFKVAQKANPDLDWIKSNAKVFEDAVVYKKYVETFTWNLELLKAKDPDRIPDLFNSIPSELTSHEVLVRLRHSYLPPKTWGSKDIAIYCGKSWETWAAPSVMKGIGGSEEAVIYIAKEFARKGWKTTVFCNCGEFKGNYEGVEYRDYYEANFNDDYNVFISWRQNIFNHVQVKAKRRLVWMHDVPYPKQFPESKLTEIDKIIVLSQFHKSLLPKYIPESKIFVSSNGINEGDFAIKKIPDRNPKRIIYTSSYDRGIQHLLEMWGDIRKQVPDAELHLFYGWETWIKMEEQGSRDPRVRAAITELIKQDGVFEHGRVGHRQLVKEFYKSGIFAYPSHFEEISYISAMKAQRCGCVPLVTNYAALQETVKAGVKVTGKGGVGDTNNRYKDELIELLTNSEYQEMLRLEVLKHKDEFSWENVAEEWIENLFQLKRNEYKDYEDYKKHYVTPGKFRRSNFCDDGTLMLHKRYQFVIDKVKELGITSVLDAGASDGALCYALNELCKIKADGVEADAKCVAFANDHAKKSGYNSKFTNCLLEEYQTDEKYDAVSALEILEHVIDPKAFLDKAESLVKDGGYIFISTPEKNGYYGEKNFNPQHIHHFTKESLEAIIGANRIIAWDNDENILTLVYKK